MLSKAERIAKAVEILRKGRSILEKRGVWTQAAMAKDENGDDVSTTSPDAKCFCAVGAVLRATVDTGLTLTDRAQKLVSSSATISDANPTVVAVAALNKAAGEQKFFDTDWWGGTKKLEPFASIIDFNDHTGRRKGEVIKMFDRAVEILEQEAA